MNNPSGRHSVIYYVYTDERLFRLRSTDYIALIKGEAKLHRFAGRELRIIEVIIQNASRKTIQSLRGLIHHFAPDGTLDIGEAAGVIDLLLHPKDLPDQGPNVLSLLPWLERKTWDERHTWTVDQASIRRINDDLSLNSAIPAFRMVDK